MKRVVKLVALFFVVGVYGLQAETRVEIGWDLSGEDGGRWAARPHHCQGVVAEGGVIRGRTSDWDPFIVGPVFEIKATAHQFVSFRARLEKGGIGGLFWVPVGAQGPTKRCSTRVEWVGGGEWQEYQVYPHWQGDDKICQIRIDFPDGIIGQSFEITDIRICGDSREAFKGDTVEWQGEDLRGWHSLQGAKTSYSKKGLVFEAARGSSGGVVSPPLAVDSGIGSIIALEMVADRGEDWSLLWSVEGVNGVNRHNFRAINDGKSHTYNIDMSATKGWGGVLARLELRAAVTGGRATVSRVVIGDEPQGPAELKVLYARLEDALNPAGRVAPFIVGLENVGGEDIKGVELKVVELPEGVRVVSAKGWEQRGSLPVLCSNVERFELVAERALKGRMVVEVWGEGVESQRIIQEIEFQGDKGLARADYVPVPRPVKSSVEIGALYYPGWYAIGSWARIWPVAPERKPVLGWYDEANPEVIDWQIKWAVENGISFKLVDWYWDKGYQHNDHWIKGFQRARYKSYLKWAVMWANHNRPGSHSEEDQRAVTRFWVDNYFKTPEYYRIDDKPVVMIWSAENMNNDLKGSDGCRRLLEISRKMAVEAGFKGIYFIAMKWPEASTDAATVQKYKDMGFDMTSIYHYMHHGGKAENPRRFHFDLVAESNYDHWQGLRETGILPFLPNLSTGWDDRPWHGDRGTEIYGRTVEHFRRICGDAKRFVAESGVERVVLAPLNEWGEGSYAEPCAEFGFGMYEVLREALCEKPAEGWPLNYGPKDVGLGPYDLPMATDKTEWEFKESAEGWSAAMGIAQYTGGGGSVRFVTTTHDPAIQRSIRPVMTRKFKQLVVEMKVSESARGGCQLFWSAGGRPSELTSMTLPLRADGEFHRYSFDLASSATWRGRVAMLRFDPCSNSGVEVEIRSIRLVPVSE